MMGASASPEPPTAAAGSEARQQPVISVEAASWSGPLPLPADFRQYEETLPGAAERILQLAERQQSHRHQIEMAALATTDKIVTADSRRSYLGIILAFIIAMTGLLGGIMLIATGRGGFGLALCLSMLVGLAAVFVYGARSRRAERSRRRAENAAGPE